MVTQADIQRLFHADLISGRLYWTVAPKQHPRLKGTEAGSLRRQSRPNGKRYCYIKINGVAYKRSHIIFCLVHGRFPAPCCDHINGDSTDDRPSNLREATVTENAWNHKGRARRIDLPMGVRLTPSGRFQARIAHFGKLLSLGAFATPQEAQSVYLAKRQELYREFA